MALGSRPGHGLPGGRPKTIKNSRRAFNISANVLHLASDSIWPSMSVQNTLESNPPYFASQVSTCLKELQVPMGAG